MATKSLFITITRTTDNIPWGFTLEPCEHKRLDNAPTVQNVVPNSPAYQAGLYPGDIVIGIDNSPITGRPLTHSIATKLVNSALHSIELQVLREPSNRVKKKTMYSTNSNSCKASPEPYRAMSVNRGVIPSVAQMDSGVRLPDNNVSEFLNEKAREQWAITKQTYRSMPLIEAKPKVRRDWPTGSYLRHMEGPGWHEAPRAIIVQDPTKLKALNQINQNDGKPMVHLQYNSPINLYSQENVNNSILPGSTSPARQYSPAQSHLPSTSPQPSFNAKANVQKPLSVDITQSPTYQFLQVEQEPRRPGHSPRFSPVTGQHSPSAPVQTPYFKSLMHSLNVSDH